MREAGLEPNVMNAALSDDTAIATLATIVRALGRIPTNRVEAQAPNRSIRSEPRRIFPNRAHETRVGRPPLQVCRDTPGFDDVLAICAEHAAPAERTTVERSPVLGDVYLIKSGRYYKIGYSVSAGRRTREFEIQLPDLPKRIHTIRTDDPRGVEAYWHKRFEAKRVRPDAEFFKLDAGDVRAFVPGRESRREEPALDRLERAALKPVPHPVNQSVGSGAFAARFAAITDLDLVSCSCTSLERSVLRRRLGMSSVSLLWLSAMVLRLRSRLRRDGAETLVRELR